MSERVRAADVDRGDEFGLTAAGFLYCALCGALILEGYQEAHRKLCPNGPLAPPLAAADQPGHHTSHHR
jgi:hypothetical protein